MVWSRYERAEPVRVGYIVAMVLRPLLPIVLSGCTLAGPPCVVSDCGCVNTNDPAHHAAMQRQLAALGPTTVTSAELRILRGDIEEIDRGIELGEDALMFCQGASCRPADHVTLPVASTWDVRLRAKVPRVGVWPLVYSRSCGEDEATFERVLDLVADPGPEVDLVIETFSTPPPSVHEHACSMTLRPVHGPHHAVDGWSWGYDVERLSEEARYLWRPAKPE